jgi:hypothetical protein
MAMGVQRQRVVNPEFAQGKPWRLGPQLCAMLPDRCRRDRGAVAAIGSTVALGGGAGGAPGGVEPVERGARSACLGGRSRLARPSGLTAWPAFPLVGRCGLRSVRAVCAGLGCCHHRGVEHQLEQQRAQWRIRKGGDEDLQDGVGLTHLFLRGRGVDAP